MPGRVGPSITDGPVVGLLVFYSERLVLRRPATDGADSPRGMPRDVSLSCLTPEVPDCGGSSDCDTTEPAIAIGGDRRYNRSMSSSSENENDLLHAIRHYDRLDANQRQACRQQMATLREAPPERVEEIVAELLRWVPQPTDGQPQPPRFEEVDTLLAEAASALASRHEPADRAAFPQAVQPLTANTLEHIATIYRRLGPQAPLRHQWLRIFATQRTPEALRWFARLLADDPPQRIEQVAEAIAPLFQHTDYDPGPLFPKLFDALEHPSVAAVVLDLSNFVVRSGMVRQHPATSLADRLVALLGAVVHQLERIEANPADVADSPEALAKQISQAIALFVPLCDALAWIGNPQHVGVLYRASEVSHRQLKTEAAYALARLGQEAGIELLVQMTAEPGVRGRAIRYLEELGQADRIPSEYRTPEARAESELAVWLAQPTQFGAPPHRLQVVDSRRLYWPGHDKPVDCYLVRYEYILPRGVFSGIGLVGPVTYALRADLSDWPPLDIYATYAGWFAQHPDIRETEASQLSPEERKTLEQKVQKLAGPEFEQVRLAIVAHFLGDTLLVATARRAAHNGVLVIENENPPHWFPLRPVDRGPGVQEVYQRFKGRKMLAAFNPPEWLTVGEPPETPASDAKRKSESGSEPESESESEPGPPSEPGTSASDREPSAREEPPGSDDRDGPNLDT